MTGDDEAGASGPALSRRTMLALGGGLTFAAPLYAQAERIASPPPVRSGEDLPPDLTGIVARYMAAAVSRPLPQAVIEATRHRILDAIAAMVSGSTLPPGLAAARFVRQQGGTPEATVLVTGQRTTITNAAFANAMFAHADETDDFEPVTKAHPGCSVVPAALAFAEAQRASGAQFIRAVALGYDLNCRLLMALNPDLVRATHRSAEGTGATIGATAAAASLAGFDEARMRIALSFAAQQTSGLWSWERDRDHIEKAFDFAAMGARNGASAVAMIASGFTGVADVLDGAQSLLPALSSAPRPQEMIAGLGTRFFVTETAIKRFSVGFPIQAPLDAMLQLRQQHGLSPETVDHIVVRLPADGAGIVTDSAMPDVNLQHLIAVALIDGTVSFEMSHSRERMMDPGILAVRSRVQVIADRALIDPVAPRSGRVEVTLKDGRSFDHFTRFPPGTRQNPLSEAEIFGKARELMSPVIGKARSEAVIGACRTLDGAVDCQGVLRPLMSAG